MGRIAGKIKINTFADLVGGDDTVVTEVPLDELHDFKGHPFKVTEDDRLREMVESIKTNGVLVPGTVRPRPEGGYEIISGHRRHLACKLAGLETMPVLIKNFDDDQATIIMVDSNLQREEILPSEKAHAYAMKYTAMKHQGSKEGGLTLDELGKDIGESAKTVQRYIWLSRLSDDLLSLVDEKRISIVCGIDLSFLREREQAWVFECIKDNGCSVKPDQTAKMKDYSAKRELTLSLIKEIFLVKKAKPRMFVIREKKLNTYFDEGIANSEIDKIIYGLLDKWKAGEIDVER